MQIVGYTARIQSVKKFHLNHDYPNSQVVYTALTFPASSDTTERNYINFSICYRARSEAAVINFNPRSIDQTRLAVSVAGAQTFARGE